MNVIHSITTILFNIYVICIIGKERALLLHFFTSLYKWVDRTFKIESTTAK